MSERCPETIIVNDVKDYTHRCSQPAGHAGECTYVRDQVDPRDQTIAELRRKVTGLETICSEQRKNANANGEEMQRDLAELRSLMPCGHMKANWVEGCDGDCSQPECQGTPAYCTVCREITELWDSLR